MRYLIVIEKGEHNYAAYSPDVPGCVATGKTARDAEEKMKSALALPAVTSTADYVEIPADSVSAG